MNLGAGRGIALVMDMTCFSSCSQAGVNDESTFAFVLAESVLNCSLSKQAIVSLDKVRSTPPILHLRRNLHCSFLP
jgi:hypothetical protein